MEDLIKYQDLILESLDFVPMNSKDICFVLEASNDVNKIKMSFRALKSRITEFFKKIRAFIKDKVYRFMYGTSANTTQKDRDKSYSEKTGTIHDELIPKDFDFYRGLGEVMECLAPFQNGLSDFETALRAFNMDKYIKEERSRESQKIEEGLNKFFEMAPTELVTNGKLKFEDYRSYPKKIFTGFFGTSEEKIHISEMSNPTKVSNIKANFDKFSKVIDSLEKQLMSSVNVCENILKYNPEDILKLHQREISLLKAFQNAMLMSLTKGSSIITNVCSMSLKSCAQAVKLQSSINDFIDKKNSYSAPKSQKEKEAERVSSKYKQLPAPTKESFEPIECMDFDEFLSELESIDVVSSEYDEFLGVYIESAQSDSVNIRKKLKMLQQKIILLIQKATQFLDNMIAGATKLANDAVWTYLEVIAKSNVKIQEILGEIFSSSERNVKRKAEAEIKAKNIVKICLYKTAPVMTAANAGMNKFIKNYNDAIVDFNPADDVANTNKSVTSLSIIFGNEYNDIDSWIKELDGIAHANYIGYETAKELEEVAKYLKLGDARKSLREFEKSTRDLKKEVNDKLRKVIAISKREGINEAGYQKCIQLVQSGTALLSTIQRTLNFIRRLNLTTLGVIRLVVSHGKSGKGFGNDDNDKKATTESFTLVDEWGDPMPEKKKTLKQAVIQELMFN